MEKYSRRPEGLAGEVQLTTEGIDGEVQSTTRRIR